MNVLRTSVLLLTVLVLSAGFVSADSRQDTKTTQTKGNAQEKLETAIPEAIRLLEAKEYATFLKTFVLPDDLKKITEAIPFDKLVKDFSMEKADVLLNILKGIKDARPTLADDGKKATYPLKKGTAPKDAIHFVKAGKLWYISNN